MAIATALVPLTRFNRSLRRKSILGKGDSLPPSPQNLKLTLRATDFEDVDTIFQPDLQRLPEDVMLIVLSFLDIPDLLSASAVCRLLYTLSCSASLWRAHALRLFYDQAQILAIDYFLKPSHLSASDLRRSIIRSDRLMKNWSQECSSYVSPPRSTRLGLALREFHKTEWFFISEKYLVMPAHGTQLIGWDIINNKCVGVFHLERGSDLLHLCSEPSTKALFALFGTEVPEEPRTKIRIVEMLFSEEQGLSNVEFKERSIFRLPSSYYLYRQALDAKSRTICTLFQLDKTGTLKLHILFDWDDPSTCVIDTELSYEPFITIIDLWMSEDRNDIFVYSETNRSCTEKRYSLTDLRNSTSKQTPQQTSQSLIKRALPVEPSSKSVFSIAPGPNDSLIPESAKHLFFTFRWLGGRLFDDFGPPHHPLLRCYIITFLDRSSLSSKPIWKMVQYYVPDPTDREQGNTAPIRRCVIILNDPVLALYGSSGLGQPITDYTFNHVGWIDQIDVPRKIGPGFRKKRVVRIATFPRPDVRDTNLTANIATLDIPETVLASACHLIIEPSICSVLIPTETKGRNEIHRFTYA